MHPGRIEMLNPMRYIRLYRNHRTMDAFLRDQLDKARKRVEDPRHKAIPDENTVLDVIYERAITESGGRCLTWEAKRNAFGEFKALFYAGHDPGAVTLCWLFHSLAQNPSILTKLRLHLREQLGSDPAATLCENPALLDKLEYADAVIKESMRLHTNIGTMRAGSKRFTLYGPPGSGWEGKAFPTEGFILWDGTLAIHRQPELWHHAGEFVPERWLDGQAEARNAWRGFEKGPRDCLGRHLVMAQLKIVLALVLPEIEVECAWEEWDRER
jgi:cytochrome P450